MPEESFRRLTEPCFIPKSRTTAYSMRKTNSQHTVTSPEMFRPKSELSRYMNSLVPVYSNFLEGVLWRRNGKTTTAERILDISHFIFTERIWKLVLGVFHTYLNPLKYFIFRREERLYTISFSPYHQFFIS